MMRNAPPLVDRCFRAANIKAAMQLHRIRVDQLAAEALRQMQGEAGFAGPRGPYNDEQRMQHCLLS